MSAGSKRMSVSYLQEEHERNLEILQTLKTSGYFRRSQLINKNMILITKDKNLKENQQNQVI